MQGGSVADLRHAFVCQRAVIHVVHRRLELLQTKGQASASWQQSMPQVVNVVLVGPLLARIAPIVAQIGALGKDQEPHGVEARGAGQGPAVTCAQFV